MFKRIKFLVNAPSTQEKMTKLVRAQHELLEQLNNDSDVYEYREELQNL